MPSSFRLFWQLMRFAASRTFCTAGSSNPIKTAMMAMTTSNSMSVKPSLQDCHFFRMVPPTSENEDPETVPGGSRDPPIPRTATIVHDADPRLLGNVGRPPVPQALATPVGHPTRREHVTLPTWRPRPC